jgi:YidC/Oxa1 family membrane protein insertase
MMNQTRSFLLIAWFLLAFLIWEAWMRDSAVSQQPATEATTDSAQATASDVPSGAVPAPLDDLPSTGAVPQAGADVPNLTAASESTATVTLANDVLRLQIDRRGGSIVQAELLRYGQTPGDDSAPVELLSSDPGQLFVAQMGLVSPGASAPTHETAFQLASGPRETRREDGGTEHSVSFVWTDPDSGVSVRRTYALEPGSYVLAVRESLRNSGTATWTGQVYRQMRRVPPVVSGGGFTNPEAYSFIGAGWYSPADKFDKMKFEDFETRDTLAKDVTGGWLAMLQHYFMAAWIPDPDDGVRFSALRLDGPQGASYLTRTFGPSVTLAPGGSRDIAARLWIGPKLQDVLPDVAPGLGLTVNYGVFTVLSDPLYWLLSKLHALFGNWGWAIVGLVVLIKLVFFKLSEAQYKSFAKMRAFQPRIEALKERYGDDKQKFQQAMMELYKKEKINPMGGCLPILVQIPVFIALYWVLLESVELRHAPWIGWIQNLTERDPYFVLPVLNALTMWFTQKLSPTPGMDPIQKKMLQFMPLAFGVMFAFFPAGLVLYWTTNGALGLLQQWLIIRRHGDKPAGPAAKPA